MSDRPKVVPWRSSRAAALLLVTLAGIAAYANSFGGVFVWDDIQEIVENPAMRRLWPPWVPMFGGNPSPARPLPYLSFAIDHAVYGDDPTGYHLTNLVLHLAAALLLFELTSRTLTSPRLRERWAGRAVPVATAVAATWVVHPLTTQAVTYVYQRIEVMAAVAMLACLVAAERALAAAAQADGATGTPAGSRAAAASRRWQTAAVAAAVAAMLSKETAVVLPLLVFSYAWSYGCVSGGPPSVAELARRHARFWLALVATWAVLAAVLVAESGAYGELGAQQHPRLAYLVTQAGVLLHYLRLSCWPAGQNLDSDWPLVRDLAAAVPQVAVVAVALVAAAWGLLRRRAWGWPAAAFFLLLAPTSSVLPVIDIANEHRMYLPLACLVTLVVAGAAEALRRVATAWPRHATLLGRMAILLAAAAVVALGAATHARNRVYHDRGRLWSDVLAKSPESPRANSIVAVMLARRGRVDEAIALARRAAARDPWGTTFHTLGEVLAAAGDHAGCERACRAGIEALEATEAAGRQPEFNLQAGLVTAVVEQGRLTEAADLVAGRLPAIRAALGEDHPITLSMELVAVRLKLMRREHDGGIAAARRLFDAATRRLGGGHPTTLSAETVLAIALAEEGDDPAAERHLRHVLAMQADAGPRGSAWRSTALLLADFLESRGQTAAAAALRTAAEPPR